MCTTPEFCKGTSMSSVIHKNNIILQCMVLLALSVKVQFTHARGFLHPIPPESWFAISPLLLFLVFYEIILMMKVFMF